MSEHAAEANGLTSPPPDSLVVAPPPSAPSSSPPPPHPAAANASAANKAKKANAFEPLVTLPSSITRRCRPAGLIGGVSGVHAPRATPRRGATVRSRRSGGIGRRAGLKIRWPSGLVGSIPTSGIASPEPPERLRLALREVQALRARNPARLRRARPKCTSD